jgi:hypothetical protein
MYWMGRAAQTGFWCRRPLPLGPRLPLQGFPLCRGDGCTTYEAGHVCTRFAFGSRKTQRISAGLYDKTAETAAKGTDWWELAWGDRHSEGAVVWRIEFEIGRAALNDLELFRPDAVLAAAPSLWQYCTADR